MSDLSEREKEFLRCYLELVERTGVRLAASESMAAEGEMGTMDTREYPGHYEQKEDVLVWYGNDEKK